MSLFFQVLASGSRGNAILVCSAKTRVLVDAGTTCKDLVGRLARTPVEAKNLDAVLITHEHSDHISAAGTLSRKFNLPVYMTRGTLENLPPNIGQCASVTIFGTGRCFEIGDLLIHPFATSHDAVEPAGFIIEKEGLRLGICTDLGIATNLVKGETEGLSRLGPGGQPRRGQASRWPISLVSQATNKERPRPPVKRRCLQCARSRAS